MKAYTIFFFFKEEKITTYREIVTGMKGVYTAVPFRETGRAPTGQCGS